jgi:hypothetical protein
LQNKRLNFVEVGQNLPGVIAYLGEPIEQLSTSEELKEWVASRCKRLENIEFAASELSRWSGIIPADCVTGIALVPGGDYEAVASKAGLRGLLENFGFPRPEHGIMISRPAIQYVGRELLKTLTILESKISEDKRAFMRRAQNSQQETVGHGRQKLRSDKDRNKDTNE